MRTIRHVKAAMFASAILATAGAVWCGSALAQQSSNDINRIAPSRDLTRSIPRNRDLTREIPSPGSNKSAPATPTSGAPIAPMSPPHRMGDNCPPVLLPPHALSPCPKRPIVVFGSDEAPEPAPPPPPKLIAVPPPQPVTPLRPVIITHDMIADLQQHLQDAGNYAGPISGVFDMPTRTALIAWQRANGKKPTGSLNATTLEDFNITRP